MSDQAEIERLRAALQGLMPFCAEDFPAHPDDLNLACVAPAYLRAYKAALEVLSGEPPSPAEPGGYSQQYADHMRAALIHISTVSTLREAHELAFNGLNSFTLKAPPSGELLPCENCGHGIVAHVQNGGNCPTPPLKSDGQS